MRHKHFLMPKVLPALILSGCVLSQEAPRNSRFFGDYSEFQPVDFKNETLVYRHPTTRVTDYNKFLIAPVSVYDNPNKKIKPINRPFYDDLALDFREKLVKLISKNYQVVSEPGPGVLRFEYAVVDIKPYVWYTRPDGTRAFRADTLLKGSKFELDCHDSLSGDRVFAISTLYPGNDYLAYSDLALIPNVQTAFDEWVKFLDGLVARAKQERAIAGKIDAKAFRPGIEAYVPDSKHAGVLLYRHPQLRVTHYQKFYIPIPILEGRPGMTADEKKGLGLKLREEAVKIFKDQSLFSNHPGPGILTMRTKINESADSYRFSLECVDPKQETLVFGMIRQLPKMDVMEAYKKWNEGLYERWQEALDKKEKGIVE